MATIPLWLLGRNVTSLLARWQTVSGAGVLANGASAVETLTGVVDEIAYSGVRTTEMINSLTSRRENEVLIESDDSYVFTEIMRNEDDAAYSATVPQYNILAKLWANSDSADHILFTLTRGGTGGTGGPGGNSHTFTGIMESYRETIHKGKCIARMTIRMVDIDVTVANPAYATAADP
jgi:hypothetical protein